MTYVYTSSEGGVHTLGIMHLWLNPSIGIHYLYICAIGTLAIRHSFWGLRVHRAELQ